MILVAAMISSRGKWQACSEPPIEVELNFAGIIALCDVLLFCLFLVFRAKMVAWFWNLPETLGSVGGGDPLPHFGALARWREGGTMGQSGTCDFAAFLKFLRYVMILWTAALQAQRVKRTKDNWSKIFGECLILLGWHPYWVSVPETTSVSICDAQTIWIMLEMSSHQSGWQIRVNEFFMWAVSSLCWSVKMASRIIWGAAVGGSLICLLRDHR